MSRCLRQLPLIQPTESISVIINGDEIPLDTLLTYIQFLTKNNAAMGDNRIYPTSAKNYLRSEQGSVAIRF